MSTDASSPAAAPAPTPSPTDPHPRLTKLIKLYDLLAPLIGLLVKGFGGPTINLPTIPAGSGGDATVAPTAKLLLSGMTNEELDKLEAELAHEKFDALLG